MPEKKKKNRYQGFPWWLNGKESTFNAKDVGDGVSIPQAGRSPGEGNGNPIQYSCQKIPWPEEPLVA